MGAGILWFENHPRTSRIKPFVDLGSRATGKSIGRVTFTINCTGASETEAALFEEDLGAPLLVRSHTYFADDESVLYCGTVTFLGDHYSFRFETSRRQFRMDTKLEH